MAVEQVWEQAWVLGAMEQVMLTTDTEHKNSSR